MNYRGAVFFDNDGTLTDDPNGIRDISPKTHECLKKLKQNGYLPVLATGRAMCYAGHIAKYFDCIAMSNGTYVSFNGKCIADNPLDEDLVKKAVKYMDEHDVCYVMDNPKKCYTKDLNNPLLLDWSNRFNIDINSMSTDTKYSKKKFYKINVMYPDAETLADMRKEFKDSLKIDIHPDCPYGDATNILYNKGTGIQQIVKELNIPIENTYAFGDGENDIDMFKTVNVAVAMGHHSPVLDSVASFVTETVANDGIALALKKLGLVE